MQRLLYLHTVVEVVKGVNMIVRDPATRKAALELIQQRGSVYYSDKYIYSAVVSSSKVLDDFIQQTFDRGEIAIVGTELQKMELFDFELKRFKTQRHLQELKDMRKFISEHPKEIAKIVRRGEA
jgi:hypothetical protein